MKSKIVLRNIPYPCQRLNWATQRAAAGVNSRPKCFRSFGGGSSVRRPLAVVGWLVEWPVDAGRQFDFFQ